MKDKRFGKHALSLASESKKGPPTGAAKVRTLSRMLLSPLILTIFRPFAFLRAVTSA